MKTILLGGPGHLLSVEADAGVQVYDLPQPDRLHRYRRKHWSDGHGDQLRAYFVHGELSDGEAEALIMVHAQSF